MRLSCGDRALRAQILHGHLPRLESKKARRVKASKTRLKHEKYPKFGGAYRSLASTVNRSHLTDLPITKKTTRRPSRSKALEANVKAEEENLILVDSSQSSRVTFDLASAA